MHTLTVFFRMHGDSKKGRGCGRSPQYVPSKVYTPDLSRSPGQHLNLLYFPGTVPPSVGLKNLKRHFEGLRTFFLNLCERVHERRVTI
jgi:hypothetical protein